MISQTLLSLLPGWHFQGLDVVGRSGGLAMGINPKTIEVISSWGGKGFLGMDVFAGDLGKNICIMNIYAPNQNRLEFWQSIMDNPLITCSTIIGGDLNFSIGNEESWGHHS